MTAATATPRHTGEPPRRPARLTAAIAAGRAAAALSRALGMGGGSTVGGRVTTALAPDALSSLTSGVPVALVSGTNGKSTTTALLAAALGDDVTSNRTGANLPPGLVAALSAAPPSRAALEVDELHLPTALRATRPRVVVLLNLSRDQLDRTHEVARIAAAWRSAIGQLPSVVVVANAADPNVVHAVGDAAVVWVRPAVGWVEDATLCPWCHAVLRWEPAGWSCSCGARQPPADVTVRGTTIALGPAERIASPVSLPGAVNAGNAAFAIAAARAMGVPVTAAAQRMSAVHEVAGRYASIRVSGRPVTMMLAKNPAGWATLLPMLPAVGRLAIGVNARTADGTDTSWLWDVEFERLAGRVVGAFGERADDLALRLAYAGAEPVTAPELRSLVAMLPPGRLTVAANYTAFEEVRRGAD